MRTVIVFSILVVFAGSALSNEFDRLTFQAPPSGSASSSVSGSNGSAGSTPVGDVLKENLHRGVPFPDEGDSVVGDHLILRNHIVGLYTPWDKEKRPHCAPKGAQFQVDKHGRIKFFSLPLVAAKKEDGNEGASRAFAKPAICDQIPLVELDVKYVADEDILELVDYKRTGVAFGTLVVPFKFRLGKDKRLVSSSTIAPYIGFRHQMTQGLGLSLMPVVAGGLALVPVKDPDSDKTETKAGISFAVGLTLTSAKNKDFSAGVLFGADYLTKEDRATDPTVNKPWLSFWLGINN